MFIRTLDIKDAEGEFRKMEEFRKAQTAIEQKEQNPVIKRTF